MRAFGVRLLLGPLAICLGCSDTRSADDQADQHLAPARHMDAAAADAHGADMPPAEVASPGPDASRDAGPVRTTDASLLDGAPPHFDSTCYVERWVEADAAPTQHLCVRSGGIETPYLCSCAGTVSLVDTLQCQDALADACGVDPGVGADFCEAPSGTCWMTGADRVTCRCAGNDVRAERRLDGDSVEQACPDLLAGACPQDDDAGT